MAVQVVTQSGRVEGEQRGGHCVFRGIPFAKPPVGALRFAAPEAPESWSGVRDARAFGPISPQSTSQVMGMGAEGTKNEDCLYLNVFTKAVGARRRPVMVWIHGGAFTLGSGSSPIYDGATLCERGDVVIVTINYRLGALGYLYTAAHGGDRAGATANAGELDQIAALQWVRANIEAFGGDPSNVTIFGESAGSMAVCTLQVMPAAQGLFARAIAQSGAAMQLPDARGGASVTEALFKELGLAATAGVEALRALPWEHLLEAQGVVGGQFGPMRSFAPMVDGVTLPQQPGDALAKGDYAKVPYVIGTNRDELNLFTAPALRELDKPMSDEQAVSVLQKHLPQSAAERIPAMLEVYRESRKRHQLPHGNRALLGAIQTDLRFRVPSVRWAEAYRAQQPRTFMYMFNYESPAMRGALRACHALEIPFVFGTLDAPMQDRFAGKGPAVEALSARMMDAWLAFAKTSNPSHPELGDWLPYDEARRATMVFDKQSKLEDAPFEEERAIWDGIA